MEKSNWHLQGYLERVVGSSRDLLLPDIEAQIATVQDARNKKRDTDHLHPSDLAKTNWCERATFYKIKGFDETNPSRPTLRLRNVFEEGHRIHAKWQQFIAMTGKLKGRWECGECGHRWWDKSPHNCPECDSKHVLYREVPVEDERHRIIGHADGVVEINGEDYLLEIKSVGLGTLRWDAPVLYSAYDEGRMNIDDLWKNLKRPLPAHNRQVQLYMHCTGVHQAIILYEWKPDQSVKEFTVKYSLEAVNDMLEGAKRVIDALDDDVLPNRPAHFMKSKECRFCPYKDRCWNA